MPHSKTGYDRAALFAAVVIVLAGGAAYFGSFRVPFLLDDRGSIAGNPTIRHLWPLGAALRPPAGGQTVEGRPLLNLSLAVNYAIGGESVATYHALNLLIHLAAGLALFGLVRRTLARPPCRGAGLSAREQAAFALAAALVWLLHPLQTEAVTYIVQRAESLAGLFALCALDAFVRAAGRERAGGWLAVSVLACLAAMATKEVAVAIPIMIALYDLTFVSHGIGELWRRRRVYYFALAATWILLAALVWSAGDRGGTIGASAGVAWWQFAATQARAVPHYLWLAAWPHPLIFDYGKDFIRRFGAVAPWLLLDLVLVGAALAAWRRRSAAGFLGLGFFLLLAPSSSVVGGVRQMVAEHRMYLPLALLAPLALGGLAALAGRRALAPVFALAAALAGLTAARNADYRSELALWSDTVTKRPDNAWAENNLGMALLARDQTDVAAVHFARAAQLDPGLADAHDNLGNLLLSSGRVEEAVREFEWARRLAPRDADVRNNLGNALLRLGRYDDAVAEYQTTLALRPDYAEAHNNLGNALAQSGRLTKALAEYAAALRCEPDYPEVFNNRGNALAQAGRLPEAIADYRTALRLRPGYAEADFNLGNALVAAGRADEAIARFESAIRLRPDYAAAHGNLGNALLRRGDFAGAAAHYDAAIAVEPGNALFHYNLAHALAGLRRAGEAASELETALRLRSDFPEARAALEQFREKSTRGR